MAANAGYQVDPKLLNYLSDLSITAAAILLRDLIDMFPEPLVLDLTHMSDVMGELILYAEVPA